MKIAYVHVLPLEYYPPARNALAIMARRKHWQIRAWTSDNRRGVLPWRADGVDVFRPSHADPTAPMIVRAIGYVSWHARVALALRAWMPDVIIAVEPHSMLAVWLYYAALRGQARLFQHFHEYYAPDDYSGPGMRLLRMSRRIERDSLLSRSEWVSQTNAQRTRLFAQTHRGLRAESARILPNYPPENWVKRAVDAARRHAGGDRENAKPPLRLVYIGALSFQDTYIRRIVEWVAARPDETALHIASDNAEQAVWEWIDQVGAPNITTDSKGVPYDKLPDLLTRHDVGLVLYQGNTLNFVHNVPNKAVEYLACGLEVWYPKEMEGMREFGRSNLTMRLREIDFTTLHQLVPPVVARQPADDFVFTAEAALAALLAQVSGVRSE